MTIKIVAAIVLIIMIALANKRSPILETGEFLGVLGVFGGGVGTLLFGAKDVFIADTQNIFIAGLVLLTGVYINKGKERVKKMIIREIKNGGF